jgi:hypothetical protein
MREEDVAHSAYFCGKEIDTEGSRADYTKHLYFRHYEFIGM